VLGAVLLLILPFTPAAPSTAGGVVPAHATAARGRSTATVAAPPVQLHVFPNRVAAFNVCNPCRYPPRGGTGQSPLRHVLQIVAEIARYRPQVISLEEICVGEANLVARYLNQLRGLQYHIALGSQVDRKGRCFPFGTAFGNAVLSAAPITDSSNHHYATPSSEPRGYVELTTTVGGQQVRVVATHLAQKRQAPARLRQARELVGAVAGTFPRTIILGDFNAIPNTPEIATVRQAGFHDADPGCNQPPFAACKATADAGPPRKKFDYIS
jgi:endonuclease/exonuclease/phosphatase family metal-dependent hydrolase